MEKYNKLKEYLCNIMNRVNSIIEKIFYEIVTRAEKNKVMKSCEFNSTIKSETGSITSMVTVTIIFFITILSSTYMLMAVQRKSQLKSQLSTREAYQEEIDNANEIYYTLIGDDASVNIKEEYKENTYTNKNVYVYSRNNKKFSVSKDGNQIATEQSSYTLTEDGTYTISINKDTELEEHIVKIDKTQPTINNIEIANITSNSFKIKVNAEDSLSGIKQIRYSIDGGENWKIPTDNIAECIIQHNGNIINNANIKIEVQDDAQNINTSSKIVEAKEVNGVTIPDGFVYVGGTRDSGLVISDAVADKEKYKGQTTVGTDLQGNQFVWIPVDNIDDYKRIAYSWNAASGTIDTSTNSEKINYSSTNSNYYAEKILAEEKTSVETNKGFYIGRYEAGDKESTNSKTLRTSSSSTNNTITVKAKQAPYNYVTKTQAKSLAESFCAKQGYTSVTSKLVSSYAWDTSIAFIQKNDSDYGNNSREGNYLDTTFSYIDITGASKTKATGTSIIVPTGQTTAINNIYDMGGNVREWTTESFGNSSYPYTYRGGQFNENVTNGPSGYRINSSDVAYSGSGFRITLFL